MKLSEYLIIESVIQENLSDIKSKEITEGVITDLINNVKERIKAKTAGKTPPPVKAPKKEGPKEIKMEIDNDVEDVKQIVKTGIDRKIFDFLTRLISNRIAKLNVELGGY